MEFSLKERKKLPIEARYSKEDLDISREFARLAYTEFGNFVKAIVLFGSAAREKKPAERKGDIDILIVINDLSLVMTPEAVESYRIIATNLVGKVSGRIHLTTLKFTSFWEFVRNGDPISINILRDGIALIDSGFFDPLQLLLYQGRIRPTWESIYNYYSRAPVTMGNSRWHLLQATLDLYWAVIDSAHAALMKLGYIPPSPEHIAEMLRDKMMKQGLLKSQYVKTMEKFYLLAKKIMHREIKDVAGKYYEELYREADGFVKHMKGFIEK